MWLAVLTESSQDHSFQTAAKSRAVKSCSSFYKKSCSEISIAISSVLSYLTNAFVACTSNAKRPSARKGFSCLNCVFLRDSAKELRYRVSFEECLCMFYARAVRVCRLLFTVEIDKPAEESRGGLWLFADFCERFFFIFIHFQPRELFASLTSAMSINLAELTEHIIVPP